ncbi:MAG TPA: DUF2062 domain-containing protein [Chthoniobacter sp.]
MKINWDPRPRLRDYWKRLRELRDAPHAIAGGVAIGLFWGFTPFTGLKTLLSIGTAWLCRCSKLPAVVAVSLHDVLTPIWPVIVIFEYRLGYWALSHPHHFPPELKPHKLALKLALARLFEWKTLELVWPIFVGSCIVGIPIAIIAYWIVILLLQRYEKKRHRHLKTPA